MVAEKKTIFLVTGLSILLAGAYAFLGPKTYEIKMNFLPPLVKNVDQAKYLNLAEINPSDAYKQFTYYLSPDALLVPLSRDPDILASYDGAPSQDKIIASLAGSITTSLPTASKQKLLLGTPLLTEVKVKAGTSQEVVLLATKIVALSAKESISALKSNLLNNLAVKLKQNQLQFDAEMVKVKKNINAEIVRLTSSDKEALESLQEQITTLREQSELERQNSLERLGNDLAIAKSLKITKPADPLDYKRSKSTLAQLDIKGNRPAGYWKGSIILKAEIKSLKARKSNDPFIKGLSGLQRKIALLKENVRINALKARTDFVSFSPKLQQLVLDKPQLEQAIETVKVASILPYRQVAPILEPSKPIAPKKGLILVVAAITGLMLGVFIALIRRALKPKETRSAN